DKRRQNIKCKLLYWGEHVSLAACYCFPAMGWLEPEPSCHHPVKHCLGRQSPVHCDHQMALRVGKEDNTRGL
ncbi:unnamed protein product, partial [Musa hybrid cultivar]